mmetsp:Transcript_13328/g.22646  ORF Transcript_13328/g.22646 Transcript_13328/m.22646 type:complete len:111 (+) Transcript_13328:580-912(+)
MTIYDGYILYLSEQEKYPSQLNWFQAFIQNMVGNLIPITNLYNKILVFQENQDQEQTSLRLGQIFYLLADFEPIDLEELEASLEDEATEASLANVLSLVGMLMREVSLIQ